MASSALTLAGTWGAAAWAQGEVYTLNPVVVTATRTEKKTLMFRRPPLLLLLKKLRIKDMSVSLMH